MKKYFIGGLLLLLGICGTYILTPRPFMVHYHANFAVYIEGKKWDFSPSNYMEEVSRCNVIEGVTPQDRIHLHDGKGGLVHVHMAASTWGDLFANIGWSMGPTHIASGYDSVQVANTSNRLYYIINGKTVMNPANIPVGSADRLIVWYGTGSEEDILAKWETLVDNDAIEYNKKDDPASCSVNTYGWLSPIANPIMEWFEGHHE